MKLRIPNSRCVKFKIGDRVVVRDKLAIEQEYDSYVPRGTNDRAGFTDSMLREYCGRSCAITDYSLGGNYRVCFDGEPEESVWIFDDYMLEQKHEDFEPLPELLKFLNSLL